MSDEFMPNRIDRLCKRIIKQQARIEQLEAVLRFYAEPKNYSDDYWKVIWKTARATLDQSSPPEASD